MKSWFFWLALTAAHLALAATPQGEPPARFSITTLALAELGVDLPELDGAGRVVANTHLAANTVWLHLGYRRFFRPLPRTGGSELFWGVGALVPFSNPGRVLRYNYVSIGLEQFITPRIYVGAQLHFSPGVLYYVLYAPPDLFNAGDPSFLLILVPSFYAGFTLF